jgi:DUF971 family protein
MPTSSASPIQLVRIDQYSPTEMLLEWTTGERFAVPFRELRYLCPCASCVDEHTGRRVIERSHVRNDVRPDFAQVVGRYALQIQWADGHRTGIYPYDYLHDICGATGRRV